jgi:hypothetical protein
MSLKEDLLLEESMLIASSGADIDRALLKIIKNYSSCYSNFSFSSENSGFDSCCLIELTVIEWTFVHEG